MPTLMSIGQFARRCRLPASTLRYYHARKLLEPAHVDPSTGYRYYSPAQLATAELIDELRRMGLTPDVIGAITGGTADPVRSLLAQRRRIESEIRARTATIGALDRLVERLARPVPYRCSAGHHRARVVPAVHGELRSHCAAADIRRLVARLDAGLRRAGAAGRGRYGAILPLDLDTEPIPASVFARASAAATITAIPTAQIPGLRYATTEHTGDDRVEPAYRALLDWIDASGLRPAGPVVEEYSAGAGGLTTRLHIGVSA
jgi:DNA-binding transcriptional MerR regulator